MIVWWKVKNLFMDTDQLRMAGLLDFVIYPNLIRRGDRLKGQLSLWIGKP